MTDLPIEEQVPIEEMTIDPHNQARIYAGETFASQKPSTWEPGKSPSSYGSRSHGRRPH